MTKIAVLHPSYGRPERAHAAFKAWENSAENPADIEYLVGLDDNDPSVPEYVEKFDGAHIFKRTELCIQGSRNVVSAVNHLATKLSPQVELLIAVADDMDPIANWDSALFELIKDVNNFTEPKFIAVSDGHRPYGDLFVYFIVNRAWLLTLGYLVYPEYTGVYADNDYNQVAKNLDAIIHAPHLVFKHNHYSFGIGSYDETYHRINSKASNEHNKKIYLSRLNRNFDLSGSREE